MLAPVLFPLIDTHRCYAVKKAQTAVVEPAHHVWVEAGRALVCKRNWTNGVKCGAEVRADFAPVMQLVAARGKPQQQQQMEPTGRYTSAKTETLTHYVDGVKHGTELRCYTLDFGRILYQCDWENGKKSGYEVRNYRNGQKAYEATHGNGVRDEMSVKTYYRNGSPRTAAVRPARNDNRRMEVYTFAPSVGGDNVPGPVIHSMIFEPVQGATAETLQKHGVEMWYRINETGQPVLQESRTWRVGKRMQDDGVTPFKWNDATNGTAASSTSTASAASSTGASTSAAGAAAATGATTRAAKRAKTSGK